MKNSSCYRAGMGRVSRPGRTGWRRTSSRIRILTRPAFYVLAFSLLVPGGLLHADEGYDLAVEQAQFVMGENYTLLAVKQMGSVGAEGSEEFGGGMMSLMSSQTAPLIQTYLYDVANLIPNSTISNLSGAFSHSIPIVIPPGRNGMQPSLAFTYNSQDSEELNTIGYGWDIPIPYVERLNKKGTEDLYAQPHFISSLSGVLATTTDASIFYPLSDDGSYLQYVFATSTNKWTVTDKNGTVYKFGHASTTQIASSTDTSMVYRWMLEETRDTSGNFVSYTYYKDGGFIYPSTITYTGNGATPGIFTVAFGRELRPDVATSTAPGFEIESRYRINQVLISINGTWARKYDLTYTSGDNDQRSLLDTITETGQAFDTGSSVTASMPAINFDYEQVARGWATTTDFALPEMLRDDYVDTGTRFADYNGDGLVDVIRAKEGSGIAMYANDGDGWNLDNTWSFPTYFVDTNGADRGVRLADVNGDGFVDVLHSNVSVSVTYLNTGSGFATSSDWVSPVSFSTNTAGSDTGARFADVNGDGLVDILRSEWLPQYGYGSQGVYLNNGSGWDGAAWEIPLSLVNVWNFGSVVRRTVGVAVEDVNNDGLADLITKDVDQYLGREGVFLNTGSGWVQEPSWTVPAALGQDGSDFGIRFADVNADHLPDFIDGSTASGGDVYINTGSNWVLDAGWALPVLLDSQDGYAVQILDVNGDSMPDFVQRSDDVHNRYLNNSNPVDVLKHIDESAGSDIDVVYESSVNVTTNPDLPFPLQLVSAVGKSDGMGAVATTTYQYENGEFYFGSPFDRTYAGFGTVTKTDPVGNVTKTYYHQGNVSATTTGEYDDHRSKIGRVYRTETYDDDENLYRLQVNGWDRYNRGPDADFVYIATSTTLHNDGDADHRDSAESFAYSTTTGSVLQKVTWGEVDANADGSFTDLGTDKRTTAFSYAASSTGYLILPSQETVTDQSAATVKETKNYYDLQVLGSAIKGNLTKQEYWVVGTSTVDIEKTYNSYGLVTQDRDPRDKNTNYTYDTYNLYPATTTNAISQVTGRIFDYSSGKVTKLTDENGRVFQTLYDPFDRIIEEKQPDLTTPTTFVSRATYQYDDVSMPRRIHKTEHLDGFTAVDSYTYTNALRKTIEKRVEAEGTNTFAVQDFTYDLRGLLESESLPFFASSTVYTGTSSPAESELMTEYEYDPLGRVISAANVLGETTNGYDEWRITTIDALGNMKEIAKDAYGNLVEVIEHNDGNEYTTVYEYDSNNKLTKITDAENNVRNFAYDGLSRRLTAQDLHDGADGTFGTWTYTYDAAGNLTRQVTPRNHTVNFTYDNINRVLTENYTGGSGTEVSYKYDVCGQGKGWLCAATTSASVINYTYNPLGLVASEMHTVGTTTYTTSYSYDRIGNQTEITYPDNSQVRYTYNSAGQLETIEQKESGGSYSYLVSNIDYSPTGKVARKTFSNGVTSSYTFDPEKLYRLTRILTLTSSSEEAESLMGGGAGELVLTENDWQYAALISLLNDSTSNEPYASVNIEANTQQESTLINVALEEDIMLDAPEEITNHPEVPLPIDEAAITEPDVEEAREELVVTDPAIPYTEEETPSETTQTGTDADITDTRDVEEVLPDVTDPIVPAIESEPVLQVEVDVQLKAPLASHLGHIALPNGRVKYAYKTNTRVDFLPASEDVLAEARKQKIAVGAELVDKRTNYSRTFSTGKEGVYVTEIAGGDPQYFEDENGDWWVVDYGYTTKEVYDQAKGTGADQTVSVPVEFPAANDQEPDQESTQELNTVAEPNALTEQELPAETTVEEILSTLKSGFLKIVGFVGRALGLVPLKVYAAISTFYPDPDSEITTVDGHVTYEASTNWSTTRNATDGTAVNDSSQSLVAEARRGVPGFSSRYSLSRAFLLFNTSAIPDSSTITSASLSLVTESIYVGSGSQQVAYLVSSNTASTTALGTADYDQIGSTSLGQTDGTFGITGDVEVIPLNASGLSHINKAGITRFAMRAYNDFANSAPGSDSRFTAIFSSSDKPGIQDDPKLIVIHSVASTGPTDLEVEGNSNPSTVVDGVPTFSAIYTNPDASYPATHCRIQVATTSDFSNTYWDSGYTAMASSTSVNSRIAGINYAGPSLASSTVYFWRIKFWDSNGGETEWNSESASFSLSELEPSDLRVEGSVNPNAVHDQTPEFSAIYNDAGIDDLAMHYQIQVATSSSFGTIYWDSTKTALASSTLSGTRSEEISYAGPTLASSTPYFWRIKFWDASDNEGIWNSATSTFGMAGSGIPEVVAATSSPWISGSTVILDRPSGLEEGDLMIAVIPVDKSVSGPPSGWTTIDSAVAPSSETGFAVYGRIADATDLMASTTTYTFTGGFYAISGAILRIVNGSLDGIQSDLTFATMENNPHYFSTEVTPTEENSLIVLGVHNSHATGVLSNYSISTYNPSWTEHASAQTTIHDDHTWVLASGGRYSTSPTGPYAWVYNYDGTNNDAGYMLLLSIPGNHSPEQPQELQISGQSDLSHMTNPAPSFSALYVDGDSGDTATHYQIQVSTSTDFSGLTWDTGKTSITSTTTEGTRTPNVIYAGPDLEYQITYYWRIKVWDENGTPGPWSEAATFTFTVSGASDIVQDIYYTYDSVGNITRVDDRSGTQAARIVQYGYDDLYRLTLASTTAASTTPYRHTFAYSPLGNITAIATSTATTTYTYAETGHSNPHAPTAIGSTTRAYDNSGNLTREGFKSYVWDYNNRMTAAGASGVATTTYGYDFSGQRITKKVGTNATTTYPNKLYSTDGATTTKQVFDNRGGLIATITGIGSTTIEYVHTDHLGGTNAITDNGGLVTQTLDYYPYGSERVSTGSGATDRHYIGERYDSESSLSYLNARYYDGGRGQFLSQDPVFWEMGQTPEGVLALMNPQAQNSYSYGVNNPITNKDPLGRYARNSDTGYSGLTGMALIASEDSAGILRAHMNIYRNLNTINSYENADIIKSIIFEEQAHGLDDVVTDRTNIGKTKGLGQITVNDSRSNLGYNSYSRRDLLNPSVNIREVNSRVNSLTRQLGEMGINPSDKNFVAYLATAYNSQSRLGKISDYGKRVQAYYNDASSGKTILPNSAGKTVVDKLLKRK